MCHGGICLRRLAYENGGCFHRSGGACWCNLDVAIPRERYFMGHADVGHWLGVGYANDVGTGPPVPVFWAYRITPSDSTAGSGSLLRGDTCPRRRR